MGDAALTVQVIRNPKKLNPDSAGRNSGIGHTVFAGFEMASEALREVRIGLHF